MSIETPLSYSDVIQDGRIKRLQDLPNEGQTHTELRGGGNWNCHERQGQTARE